MGRRPRSDVSRLVRGAAALILAACAPSEPPPVSDPELRAELGISAETPIHRVDLGGDESGSRMVPRVVEARPGDVVQFVTLDHRAHLVRFLDAEMGEPQLAFLRSTGQDRPPPLVTQGARLVLTFEGAEPGSYPFVVEGNGTSARGEIRVTLP